MGRRSYGRGRHGRFMRSELGINGSQDLARIRQQQEQGAAKIQHDEATGHEAEVRARLEKSPKFKLADGSIDYKKINWFIGKLKREGEIRTNPKRRNPPSYPAMSYAAAHKWEAEARKRGVSQVARSSGGFMRAYQRAGSFAKLPESWKQKRNAFIARHLAQAKDEQLWKDGKPSRRALALIMWAYMPPRNNPDLLQGGLGDKLRPKDVDQRQLKMGIKVEMEHTSSRALAKEIALDHLAEYPDYYTRLAKMEKEAERALKKRRKNPLTCDMSKKQIIEETRINKKTGKKRPIKQRVAIAYAVKDRCKNPLALAMSPRKLARINTAKYGRSKALSIARKNLDQAADSYDREFYSELVRELGGKVRKNPRRLFIVQTINKSKSTLKRPAWKQASKHYDYANALVKAYKHLDKGHWVRIVDQHGTVLAGMKSKDGRRLLVRGNPPALLKGHPDFFLRVGQSQEGLKQVRQDIYEKTGRWLPLDEVRRVLQDAQVAYNMKQIRIVK